jgi:uncharacterized protein YhfF
LRRGDLEGLAGTVKADDLIRNYWEKFLASLPADSLFRKKTYSADGFGDSPEMADELGRLVLNGKKTATCSSVWEWEAEGEAIPESGSIWIVLDGQGKPICITETYEVSLCAYNEVDANFARAEGEGDLTLTYWRQAHREYFSRALPRIGKEFSEGMLLVCERFRVIYK